MQNTAAFQWNTILNLRHSFDLATRLKLINTKAYWPCVHVCLMFIYSPLVTYPNQNVYGKFPITIEYKNSYRIPCKIERWFFGALCVWAWVFRSLQCIFNWIELWMEDRMKNPSANRIMYIETHIWINREQYEIYVTKFQSSFFFFYFCIIQCVWKRPLNTFQRISWIAIVQKHFWLIFTR